MRKNSHFKTAFTIGVLDYSFNYAFSFFNLLIPSTTTQASALMSGIAWNYWVAFLSIVKFMGVKILPIGKPNSNRIMSVDLELRCDKW